MTTSPSRRLRPPQSNMSFNSHSYLTPTGVDFVQERILGEGPQDNESAIEQAKDEKISDFIRSKYKTVTGKDIPVEDKS